MSQTDSTRKRIVVCCDGTWQSSVSGLENIPSNVTRLARHLACDGKDFEGQEWDQIVYYDSGVGTGDIGLQTLIQGGSGRGLATNVIEAYNFIVLNYKPGDKIYCFGFSRGAYTARAVAGLVTDIGIIKPRDMQEFPALYKLYQQNNKGDTFRKSRYYHDWIKGVMSKDLDPSTIKDGKMPKDSAGSRAQAQGETSKLDDNTNWDIRPHDVPRPETRIVEVVGVFDTVGSLGIPDIQGLDMSIFRKRYAFHNVKLSPFIRNAYHALAIDEHRGPFTPTLWYIPYKKTTRTFSQTYEKDYDTQYREAKTEEEKVKAFQTYMQAHEADFLKGIKGKQKLYQVWFPGMHINIGGGSDTVPKDVEQMANITFCWMAELLRPHLTLDMKSTEVIAQERKDAINRTRRMKDYGSSWYMSYLNHALEYAKLKNIPYYHIEGNVNGWATGTFEDSYRGVMKLAGSITRHPGQCIEDRSKLPLSQLGWTCEYIHPCVKYRMEKLEHTQNPYHPEAMNGYERKFAEQGSNTGRFEWAKAGGGWAWDDSEKKVVESDVQIPEWVIYQTKGDSEFDDRSFERAAMIDDVDAQEWIKTLDMVYEGKFSKESL